MALKKAWGCRADQHCQQRIIIDAAYTYGAQKHVDLENVRCCKVKEHSIFCSRPRGPVAIEGSPGVFSEAPNIFDLTVILNHVLASVKAFADICKCSAFT
jgi:hypothetical protein